MIKKVIAFLTILFVAGFSAFAEFDDDIYIETGDFSLWIGWGLDYTPESIDKNETIFPLLQCVEKYYDQLKSINRDFTAMILHSKENPGCCELWIYEHGSENSRDYICKNEEECVSILTNLVAKIVPVVKPNKIKDEVTIYLLIKKCEYENENDLTGYGEFERHLATYNITKDNYFYTMYFSLEEAEKKARENPAYKIRKYTCTKENINRLDINWDSVIGN